MSACNPNSACSVHCRPAENVQPFQIDAADLAFEEISCLLDLGSSVEGKESKFYKDIFMDGMFLPILNLQWGFVSWKWSHFMQIYGKQT